MPAPCTLRPAPRTLHPEPCTLNPAPSTLNPAPSTLHPAPLNHSQSFSATHSLTHSHPLSLSLALCHTLTHTRALTHTLPSEERRAAVIRLARLAAVPVLIPRTVSNSQMAQIILEIAQIWAQCARFEHEPNLPLSPVQPLIIR